MTNEYCALCRAVTEEYVLWNKTPVVRAGYVICDEEHFRGIHLSDNLYNKKSGVFVCIKKHGKLRGLMGTLFPKEICLGAEIVRNAISAAVQDMRFEPVTAEELSDLEYSVYVVGNRINYNYKDTDGIKKDNFSDEEKNDSFENDSAKNVSEKNGYEKNDSLKNDSIKNQIENRPAENLLIVSTTYRSGIVLPDEEGITSVHDQLNEACKRGDISMEENPEIQFYSVIKYCEEKI